uniref:Protein kinase domain-containing protein n=1 Tax=Oryza nivara TaxID=4536 RepID=A0A0E0GB21_ORYNI
MEQLRQLGEAVGSINALMAFEADLRINPRQCRLLADACARALAAVTGQVRAQLRFDERGAKWRAIEAPLRELHRAFRDAEAYVRQCLDPRGSWWARAAAMAHGTECVEQHLHNVLWCVAVALEAIDAAGEIAGSDPDELARGRLVLARKYDRDMLDPKLFEHAFGKLYLVSQELVARMDMAWKEDRWVMSQMFDEMKGPAASKPLSKNEHRLAELLAAAMGKLHPASVLLGSDYSIRRRLGGRLKEVHWMGESFAMKHFIGDTDAAGAEVALLCSVAHPNVAHAAYCFHDEEKKEYFVVMDQLMAKDLGSYVKEVSCPRRRIPFPLVVAVDIMLQIARGMEYLHAKRINHGELNPSNVLVKPRQPDGGYVHVKVARYGQPAGITAGGAKASANGNANGNDNSCIWYAPEVLRSDGVADAAAAGRCTEKADVYSFAMICFELLTGKVPFEDNHLQGDKTSKNICAGERPLFPFQAPKYLTALTKRCWHADPAQRPAFASICRVLRYVKRFLILNPEQQQQQQGQTDDAPKPAVDYLDIEAQLLKKLPAWQRGGEAPRVADVPFQMFAYRVMEREKAAGAVHVAKDRASDSGSDGNSLYGDENGFGAMSPEHTFSAVSNGNLRSRPASSDGRLPTAKKADGKAPRQAGPQPKVKPVNTAARTPQSARRALGVKPDDHLQTNGAPTARRRTPEMASE